MGLYIARLSLAVYFEILFAIFSIYYIVLSMKNKYNMPLLEAMYN